jgi:Arc/MetJ-type ribon-helix-helix transcriptional regulator
MVADLERVRKREHRTRSELVREALRQYMARTQVRAEMSLLREDEPAADELKAIGEGRREFREGKFVRLEDLYGMGRRTQQTRRKKPQRHTAR